MNRLFLKAIIYRAIAFVILSIVTYLITGSIVTSALLAIMETVISTVTYILFDIVWKKYLEDDKH
jgi:uncharacterized membrane protein